MVNIVVLADKNESDKTKLDWLIAELNKRDITVTNPELPTDFSEWDKEFKNILESITPDTIILTKGLFATYTLKQFESRPIGVKGLLIMTDNTNTSKIQELDYATIKKKSLNFFIYAFQNNETFTPKDAEIISDKLEAELSILEGAEDNSDYEEILIDIISLEHQ